MDEARIEETDVGLVPADGGWFILNLAEMGWETAEGGGIWCSFESPSSPSPLLGIGVHVLRPGESSGFYHAESNQEGFLVLSGECIAIVEGQEHRLRTWDYLHCPPGILMVGARSPDSKIHYPVDPLAAKHGASVETATDSPREAYAGGPPIVPTRSPWPLL